MNLLIADTQDYFGNDAQAAAPPVYPALNRSMDVSLLVNERSEVWLVYTKRLSDVLMWAEYDIELRTLVLVFQDGKQQDVGFKIHEDMRPRLLKSRQLYLMQLQGEQIVDSGIMPLIVRDPNKPAVRAIIES